MGLPLPNTTEVKICNLTKALYNAAPGYTYMSLFTSDVASNGMDAFANWLTGTVSDDAATLASTVATNLGLTGDALIAGTAYLTAELEAHPGTYGEVILDTVELFSTLTSDATYGTFATAYNDSVATSYSYSITTTNTSVNLSVLQAADEVSAVTGQTFTLTTGADNLTGTDGGDTFDASLSSASMTFGAADSIDGGAGTDTLTIIANAAGTYSPGSLKNVENVVLSASGGATTLALTGATGIEKLTNSGSSQDVIFSGLSSLDTEVAISNTSATSSTTVTFTAATVAGSSDAATISLNGLAHATTNGTDFVSVAGVETLNIKTTGSASTIDTLTTAAATKYVVTGDQNLTVGATLGGTVLTVDANAMTGGLTFTANAATAMTVTGGAGNDAFTFTGGSAVNDSINAGAGNDTITYVANLATTDTIDGGEGTDTLVLTSAVATGYTKPSTATITNFETLKLSDALGAGLTVANIQTGLTTLDLNAGSGAQSVTMEAGTQTIKIGAANTGTLTVSDTGTATTDSLTLTNNGSAISMFGAAAGGLAVTGYETVTINTTGKGAATTQAATTISVTADSGGTATLNLTGSNTLTTTGAITAKVIDASGLTGSAVLTMGAAAVGATKITGSGNSDTLIGIAATATSIDGGAGNDTITGGSGNDTLVGGAGNDSITAGAGNDSIDAGAGNDTIVMAGNLATGDVIDGGDGTDTVSITSAGLGVLNGYAISAITGMNNNISNVERVLVSDTLNLGTAFDMARLDSINHVTLADGITGDESLTGLAANTTVVAKADNNADTDILTLALADSSGSADVLNYTMTQAATDDYGVVAVSGVETLNITANEASANATVRVATLGLNITTATAGTTVNFLGTESITIDTAIAAQTIDATGMGSGTNFIMTNATGSGLSQTITTGAGADTIYGGGGADTIDAGAGADSIVGGTGADSITAGDGADTIVGGSGNDAIILTESTASTDVVVLDYSEGGAYIDRVTGFTTGTGGDTLTIDLSALEAVLASGGMYAAQATNFIKSFEANSDAADGEAGGVQVLTAGAAVTADDSVMVLSGASFSATSEIEDALETGGSFALSFSTTDANLAQYDQFLVAYTDGTDAHLAVATIVTDPSTNGVFAAGALVVKDLVTLVGVSSITSTTFVDANFAYQA